MPAIWIEATLFYVCVDRVDGDPPDVIERALVLWGEGHAREGQPDGPRVRRRALGNGLFAVDLSAPEDEFREHLARPDFDLRLASTRKCRLILGLIARPPVPSIEQPDTLEPLFAHGAVGDVEAYVRANKAGYFAGDEARGDALERALDRLEELSAVSFRLKYPHLLGDVCIRRVRTGCPRRVDWTPWKVGDRAEGAIVVVDRRGSRNGRVTVRFRAGGTDPLVVDDRTFDVPAGAMSFRPLRFNQAIGSADVSVWNDGLLVWDEKQVLVLEVHLAMHVAGPNVLITDRLSRAVRGGNSDAVSKVTRTTRDRHMIAGRGRDPWREASITGAAAAFTFAPPRPEHGTYFPPGLEGRASAVLRIAEIISASSRTFIVDPFLDALGLEELLPRVGTRNVEVIAITSLTDDADVERLRTALVRLAGHGVLPAAIEVYRVTSKGGDQWFHDRFLIAELPERRPAVYMLSNSLSGAARYYSLIVQQLDPGVAAAVFAETVGHLEGEDEQRIIDKLWPPPPPASPASYMPTRVPFLWRAIRRWAPAGRGRECDAARQLVASGWVDHTLDRWGRGSATPVSIASSILQREMRAHDPGTRLGEAVEFIGELSARGLDLNACDVLDAAQGVVARHTLRAALEVHLRPAPVRQVGSGERARADENQRALLLGRSDAIAATRAGFGAAFDTDRALTMSPQWGRSFAYAVLLELAPASAVRLCMRHGDTAFTAATLGAWGRSHVSWRRLAPVLLRTSVPYLRALGAQMLVTAPRQNFEHHVVLPRLPRLAFRRLRGKGATSRDCALFALVWGRAVRPRASLDGFASELLISISASDGDTERVNAFETVGMRNLCGGPRVAGVAT